MSRITLARDDHPERWWMLALVSGAELLGMSLWFTAGAVAPDLQRVWGLDAAQTGLLTTAVQVGFVAGTAIAALLNLADIVPAPRYVAASAALAAVANAALIAAPGYAAALGSRFLTGMFLAGVYPPAMKMIATWFRSARGLAIGTVVGALTAGKAAPYLLKALETEDYRHVVLAASGCGLAASVLVLAAYRDGPYAFRRGPFSWSHAGMVLRHRPTRLAIGGYLGHMWELYAMWTWMPAFAAASLAARAADGGPDPPSWLAPALAFGAIAAGGPGCVWGGWQADRIGRERLVNLAMAASGTCCVAIGLFYGSSPWLVAVIAWIWGFFVVADSAQFSAIVTEVAPPQVVGTALTLQTSLGFLLTVVTIQLVPGIAAGAGWRWAFPVLALGPAAGIAAIRRLSTARASGEAGPEAVPSLDAHPGNR